MARGEAWTPEEDALIEDAAERGWYLGAIRGLEHRTYEAIRRRASRIGARQQRPGSAPPRPRARPRKVTVWDLLRVSRHCHKNTARAAWRRWMQAEHPDKHPDDSRNAAAQRSRRFAEVKALYEEWYAGL